VCLALGCGQAPEGGHTAESALADRFATLPLRRIAVLPFASHVQATDPDGIAAPMAASMLGAALQERRGAVLVPATADLPEERRREFYSEWSADREFADPAFVREIAAADSADAVLVGSIERWEQRAEGDGFETRIELQAGLFEARSGEWAWYGRHADARTNADKPPDYSYLLRSMVAGLVATIPTGP
jgi:hypothetical protein